MEGEEASGTEKRAAIFIGGIRFEVEYAVSLGIPVQIYREKGLSQWIFQYSFGFLTGKGTFSWHGKDFSIKSVLSSEGHDEVRYLRYFAIKNPRSLKKNLTSNG